MGIIRGMLIFLAYEHTKPAKPDEPDGPKQTMPLPPTPLPSAGTPDLKPSGPGGPADPQEHPHSSGAVDWVNAAEFVPGQPYCGRGADPVPVEGPGLVIEEEYEKEQADKELKKQLCPYAAVGECRYGLNCAYLHGDICDMCGLQVLHPSDSAQRSQHIKACIEAHEKDMEISFAIQRSKDMMCGVCMEVVFEKANPGERRFGILSNCSHCYCLKCIRKWRSAKQFESKIIKSCPECRITSNFVIPSEYWVEDKEEKQKLIQKYKDGMGRTPLWDLFDERESSDSFDNEDEEMVTFELSEMLLMLLAAGTDDEVTDSEDEWDLFHEELDDYYEVYL
ncbi:hypothetical protein JZ751_022260 [Albula glossodonta]|uniref:RING-type E3 ubiquitin transferase n=1 Tax=Albula glossodonta TaxID=121402 RepID=A0A8T2NHR8_9TELE|nr:hypothetical protein JZ751_022260 [Albula glossodonta]